MFFKELKGKRVLVKLGSDLSLSVYRVPAQLGLLFNKSYPTWNDLFSFNVPMLPQQVMDSLQSVDFDTEPQK